MRRKSLLLCLGGLGTSAVFHTIPWIRKHRQRYKISWAHGASGKEAVQFLKDDTDLGLDQLFFFPESDLPKDLISRLEFLSRNQKYFPTEGFDRLVTDPQITVEFKTLSKREITKFSRLTLRHSRRASGNYFCLHLEDPSAEWKTIPALEKIRSDLPIKVIGQGRGPLRIPEAEDYRNLPLRDTAELIYQSRFIIGIHSSLVTLGFYLGKPVIACHFTPKGLFNFSEYHSNCIDLLDPTEENINQALLKISDLAFLEAETEFSEEESTPIDAEDAAQASTENLSI